MSVAPFSSAGLVEPDPIVIGFSLPALFDMTEPLKILRKKGVHVYLKHMRERADEPLAPAAALLFAKKMLSLNDPDHHHVRVHVATKCHGPTVCRVWNSLKHHGLICAGEELGGRLPITVCNERGNTVTDLFRRQALDFYLSTDRGEVRALLRRGYTAGVVPSGPFRSMDFEKRTDNLSIAADFDRVLAIPCGKPGHPLEHVDCEHFTHVAGVMAARDREEAYTEFPAHPGPAADFFKRLIALRNHVNGDPSKPNIALIIVTARMENSRYRIHTTLEQHGLNLDDLHTTGDDPKGIVIRNIGADFFVDDSLKHFESVRDASPLTLPVHMPWVDEQLRRFYPGCPSGTTIRHQVRRYLESGYSPLNEAPVP